MTYLAHEQNSKQLNYLRLSKIDSLSPSLFNIRGMVA